MDVYAGLEVYIECRWNCVRGE